MPSTKAGIRWKIAQWAERLWWKKYLRKKNVAEYLAWKKQYWHNFLRKIDLGNLASSQGKIIDLGCGPAGIFMNFDQAQVTAVDPLLDGYELDLPHFEKTNYPNVCFVNASMEDFKPAESYDFIFCINAINHVDDVLLGFEKLRLCAHDESVLVLSIDAHNHNFLKKIFQWLPGDILHPHQYNLVEYQELLQKAGWHIAKSVEVDKAFIFNYYVLVATPIKG